MRTDTAHETRTPAAEWLASERNLEVKEGLVSTLSDRTGSHSCTPAPRDGGDEHATPRPASSESDRRAGTLFKGVVQ